MPVTNTHARWSLLLVVALAAVACTDRLPGIADRPGCLPKDGARLVAEGEDAGHRWRLFAAPEWEDRAYGLELQSPVSSPGCGTAGNDDDLLGITLDGGEVDGRSIRIVYGAVLPPVASVRLSFDDGRMVELEPVAMDGFDHLFFAHFSGSPAGFRAEALDARGEVIASSD